ncbi:MAG TPA: GNAT family N-acetyltransferase [Mycobacteriales bacterium]|nr:GNAT family N-acetyltransferase [Mycobacteriales bacterium]
MSQWRSALLAEEHDLASFDSGVAELTTWLNDSALRAQRAGTARTYVWAEPAGVRVVAYYSVTPAQVSRADVPRSFSAGFSVLPTYLLARLALDRSLHGRGQGTQLLLDALEVIVAAAGAAGGRLILVDAIDDAAHGFYRHHGFQPVTGTGRLVMKVETARTALHG